MEEQRLNFYQINTIKRRNFLFYLATILGSSTIGLKLWSLQVLDQNDYKQLALENRIRIKLIASPRGSIFDENNLVIATNSPTYDLLISREDLNDPDLLIRKLAFVLGLPVEKFAKIRGGLDKTSFLPVPVKSNISYEQMAVLSSFNEDFPGVLVEHSLIRDYPLKDKASHLLGFVNWTSGDILEKTQKKQIASYQKIGQTGVEGAFNAVLIGYDGGIQNEVNSAGQPVRVLDEIAPTPGADIFLSINSRLQEYIYDNMPYNGAVIVGNPYTGDLISMVSKPGYDPNHFVDGIDPDEWKQLLNDEDKTLNDRCIRGTYSPGSTFKPVIALAGLTEGAITPSSTTFCPGYYRQGNQVFHCWKLDGHGTQNCVEAIQHSCDVFFYQLGKNLGIQTIAEYAKKFGFGDLTGIAFPHELSGVLPTPEWKVEKLKQHWLPGETINISIGQGYLTATPLQLLVYWNGVITSGHITVPGVLKHISSGEATHKVEKRTQRRIDIPQQHYDLVRKGLDLVVNGPTGTGAAAKSNQIEIGGKTGTTQVISFHTRQKILQRKKVLHDKYKNHGWFVGHAPATGDPEVSIVVLLENAGSSSFAAHFGKQVLEYYFQLKNGTVPPVQDATVQTKT